MTYRVVLDPAKRAWSRWSVYRVNDDGTETLVETNLGKGEAQRVARALGGVQ